MSPSYVPITNNDYLCSVKDFIFKDYPTIDYMLRTTWNAVVKTYNNEAAKRDYSMAMGFTLLAIDPKKGTQSTLLGPRMGVEPTSLSRTLKNLEELKLIERHPNPEDGRSVIIKLTKLGQEHRTLVKEIVIMLNEKLKNKIGITKLKIFFEVCFDIKEILADGKIT